MLDAWEADGITELPPIQQRALDANVFDHESVLIIGPTTSKLTANQVLDILAWIPMPPPID